MKIKAWALLFCAGMIFTYTNASNKEKKNRVKTVTEYATVYEKGKALTYKNSYEEYDKNGKMILKVDFKRDGSVNFKITSKYNLEGDKTEEIEYDGSGKIKKKTLYSYNAQGEKDTETDYEASGKILKKDKYSYNIKDLKTEKKTYNAVNSLESVKKWEYSYY